MKTKALFLLATSFLALTGCNAVPGGTSTMSSIDNRNYWSSTYQNPLFVTNSSGNFYSSEIADPCVVKGDDGYLYAFATNGRVLRSEDGCAWTVHLENAITRPTWGDSYYGGEKRPAIWAPDVVKVGDQLVMPPRILSLVLGLIEEDYLIPEKSVVTIL